MVDSLPVDIDRTESTNPIPSRWASQQSSWCSRWWRIGMKPLIFCVFAIMALTPAQGHGTSRGLGYILNNNDSEKSIPDWSGINNIFLQHVGEEEEKLLMDSAENENKDEVMKCFQCDLGFWDVCYTTKTICSPEERCFTGRGKAGDVDIKTLGCVKAEECGVETTVQLFANKTIFAITKHCCNTPFCNSAHRLDISTLFYLAWALLATWHLTGASVSS